MNNLKRDKYYYPKIYGLICPIEKKIKYIGVTKRYLKERLHRHVNPTQKDKSKKIDWILDLKSKNLIPEIKLIEKVEPGQNEIEREKYWIQKYSINNLYNSNSGGNKPPNMSGWNKKKLDDSIINQLGKMPDYKLAEIAGCTKNVIARARKKHGIKSYAKRTGNDGKFK